jgi:integrase/recombinase XerD
MKSIEKKETGNSRAIRMIAKGGKVALRARKGYTGTDSLFLDYKIEGKRFRQFIDLYLYPVKSALDREANKETVRIAESLRAKKELALNTGDNDIYPQHLKKVDFIVYFNDFIEKYQNKDKRLVSACSKHFFKFIGKETFPSNELTENVVRHFKTHLETNLKGETPSNYFKKFKKVVKYAVNDGIFKKDPTSNVTIKKTEGIKKEILLMNEIQLLANAECGNDEIKKAFLFCCVTGLRFCDVNVLTWERISGAVLKITQLKTNRSVIVNLNSSALIFLPAERGSSKELVFNLPSSTACNKTLGFWVKRAKIDKKITWHCARHSFGTNLVLHGGDLRSTSSLLGHSNTRQTEPYVRIADSLKEKSVFNLPTITIE